MQVFPISDNAPTGCSFTQLENGTVCLLFRCENEDLCAYSVVTEPQKDEYVLLDSFISGGSFAQYLRESMERFGQKVCLYLRPQAMRFSLPCSDGRGEEIEMNNIDTGAFRYSETLCCLWRISKDGCTMELTDCDRSLREKFVAADACGIPLLIADEQTLKIATAKKG